MKNKEVTKVSDYIDIVKELTENQVEIAKEQSQLLNFLKENKKARTVYEKWGGELSSHEQPFERLGKGYNEVFYTYSIK